VRAIASDEDEYIGLIDDVVDDERRDGQVLVDGCLVWMCGCGCEMRVVSGRVGGGWGSALNK
jgi:hypothetical protein